ncbi:MAG: hypothetical protein VYE22_20095 [Myxococcota bacterium]|nr:hypothetical protein [Myxococcota bacterium]
MTPLAELVELLACAESLPVPSRYGTEIRLPGAMASWRAGLEEERAAIERLLFTPQPGASAREAMFNLAAVNAAQRRAIDDARMYAARFEAEPLGRRLRFLARAEVASRAARQLATATRVA